MKYFLPTLFSATLLFLTLAPSVNAVERTAQKISFPIVQPKIIGGELANKAQWPWMSALVYTYNEVTTSLIVNGITYESGHFTNSPAGQVTASLIDCGNGDNSCEGATDKICLISRGDIDFSLKADNCQAGGGVGVIIYNNIDGNITGTLGDNFAGSIPVISVTQEEGATLLNNLIHDATINVSAQDSLLQAANCGATFIGKKWVLTAAHCVEGVNPDYLKVNVGEYDLTNGAEKAKSIKRIYIHPEYNEGVELDNDIALIELTESFDHPAVTLLDYDTSRLLAAENRSVTVIGWGNMKEYGPNDEAPDNSQPDLLHQVDLSLLSNEQCKNKLAQAYSDLHNANYSPELMGITDSMICAGFLDDVPKGSCQGDSGGPLLVDDNGWKQIGIVSYGVGCANAAFPDVFSRVGNFTDWINGITKGIAIDTKFDFPITAHNIVQTNTLTVSNNSNLTANLTYSVLIDKLGSTGFTLNSDDCAALAANQTCELEVTFDAKKIAAHKVRVLINSNDINIPTTQSYISAQAISESSNITTQLSNGSADLRWFSGGDKSWLLDNTEAAIKSGDISNNQQSAVMLTFTGAGSLSFEWSVSSEAGTDSSKNPYDGLYLLVDGKESSVIFGEVKYASVTIPDFSDGYHQVTWLYKKDGAESEGDDKGRLKNVIFTPKVSTTPPKSNSDDSGNNNSSGGSMSLLLIFLIICRFNYRLH